ncbi:MAG: hypothetical protein KF760_25150 [Candidatus Eremiobacteraeota bacterium]|nr:hypothetical protein [Candidatus Eremiobacteraeota bacterium]MCW5871028.1 hypothetical protein [Candidatus Eremiobacteraeota bacterium]
MDRQFEEKKDERIIRDYERPEDRIPHEGEGMDTELGDPKAASNQQHDMGSVRRDRA